MDPSATGVAEPETLPAHAGSPHPAPHRRGDLSLLDLLIVLAERKRRIAWITVGFAALAVVVSLILPKRYTATVTLLPPQQNSSLSAQLASQLGSLSGVAALAGGSGSSLLKNPNDMYVAMLKSRTVEDAMVHHFSLMQEYHERYLSDARKKFESRSSVDGSGKDGMIHISVEDADPQRAAQLANGYLDQFRELSKSLAFTEAQQRGLFFGQQLEQAKNNLANAEEALTETEQKTGVIQLDSQAKALIESAAAIRAQITAKEVQIQGMQTYATGQNAQVIEAQEELSGLRAQLAQLESGSGNSTALIVPKGQVTQAGMEYVRKLRDVKYYETIFEILARQYELAKLDEAREGATIQVVDQAVPPDKRSFPKRTIIILVTTVLGFFIGIFVVLMQAATESLRENPASASKLAKLRHALAFRRQPTQRA